MEGAAKLREYIYSGTSIIRQARDCRLDEKSNSRMNRYPVNFFCPQFHTYIQFYTKNQLLCSCVNNNSLLFQLVRMLHLFRKWNIYALTIEEKNSLQLNVWSTAKLLRCMFSVMMKKICWKLKRWRIIEVPLYTQKIAYAHNILTIQKIIRGPFSISKLTSILKYTIYSVLYIWCECIRIARDVMNYDPAGVMQRIRRKIPQTKEWDME